MNGDLTLVTLAVGGMHCASCGLLIDETLEELDGVVSSETDARRGRSLVRFDPATVAPDDIVAAIEGVGYRAAVET